MSNYYVSGCVADGDEVSTCDDSVAQFWTLYRRNEEGLSEGIIDCMFREDAEAAMRVYKERDALAAENAIMQKLLTDISENHVEYFSEGESGMFAGVPLDYVSEINMYVSRDVNAENPFPATDSYLNSVRAEGVEMLRKLIEHTDGMLYADSVKSTCTDFAAQLRAGEPS